MASKEEIERRVQDEAEEADDRYTKHKGDVVRSFQAAVRPLVERVIELEGKLNGSEYDRVTACEAGAQLTAKLAAADARGDDLAAALHNMTRERDELGVAMVREGEERARLTDKLKSAEQHVIEQGRTIEVLNSDRSRILADLTEARASLRTAHAELRTATREHDETTAALRAQIAALQGVIDGHEQAIKDACSDVRAKYSHEVDRLLDRTAALETTVDVLAGRLAARGA